MQSLHLFQLLVQLFVRIGQELSLSFEFFFYVFIDVFLLPLVVLYISVKLFHKRYLEHFIVVNVLSYPVDGIPIDTDISIIATDFSARVRY